MHSMSSICRGFVWYLYSMYSIMWSIQVTIAIRNKSHLWEISAQANLFLVKHAATQLGAAVPVCSYSRQLGWDIQAEHSCAPAGSWSNSVASPEQSETMVFIRGFKADTQAEIALIFLFLLTQRLWGICASQEASDSHKKGAWREAYNFLFVIWWQARLHEFITEE